MTIISAPRPDYLSRRALLTGAAGTSLALLSGCATPMGRSRGRLSVRIASNQGVENATLQQLIRDRGIFEGLSLDTQIVESKTISGPMEALLAGTADVCMISGFVGVVPAIEQGKPLRLIGTAMELPALALFSANGAITSVQDLAARTVGIGGTNGLLHLLSLELLRRKGVDPSRVKFVNVGSNAQVFDAVASGNVDAGLSGPAGLSDPKVHVVGGGQLWEELRDYPYQPAYASGSALRERPEAIARCLAGYARLFQYLSRPDSRAAYLAARRKVAGEESLSEGEAVWSFVQRVQPYGRRPGISPAQVAALQRINLRNGLQQRILPYGAVADPLPARLATRYR